jgi:hypothetical protein
VTVDPVRGRARKQKGKRREKEGVRLKEKR